MYKKILIALACLAALPIQAMQKQAPQKQVQKPKAKKQSTESIDLPNLNAKPNDADTQTDVKTDNDQQTIADTANNAITANDTANAVDNPPTQKEHIRICPLCGNYSAYCPDDQDRLKQNIVLPCACNDCC